MAHTTGPERFSFQSGDGTEIVGYRWRPDGAPRGVVQIAHGMGEHILRYEGLARRLTGAGFLVAGNDHRGHGATAAAGDSAEPLGQIGADGWTGLVDDIHVLALHLRSDNPGLPLVLVAHSMGSFAAQQYVLDHSDDIEGLVLTGTAALDLLEPYLDLERPLDLTAFNAVFEPARTDYDWLSRDRAQVDAYIADPWCGFGLDPAAGRAMFAGARALADPARVAKIRPGLPIYVAAGELDPVNSGLQLVHPVVERFRNEGLDVQLKIYPQARHEVLNETNRDEVMDDVIGWIEQRV